MSDKGWKAYERRLARDVGVERIPVTGANADRDFEDGIACYQAKCGYKQPSYLLEWLSGICGTAQRIDKVGVVVWKPKGKQDIDALVFLRWKDWVDLHGTPNA
jgi:hypothetical protein